jgi:hypothetical protein
MLLLALCVCALACASASAAPAAPLLGRVVSLDSPTAWVVAADPGDEGKAQRWFAAPRPDAKPLRVPGTMQEALGEVHGVAWYWRSVDLPPARHKQERLTLRFWSVDYLAEVWVNDVPVGRHECADAMFDLDITKAARPGSTNRIAVRVVNPSDQPIDGLVVGQTPGRNRGPVWGVGSTYNAGGIQDSVELLAGPPVRIADLALRPDPRTGVIAAELTVDSALRSAVLGHLTLVAAEASGGPTLETATAQPLIKPGRSVVRASVRLADVRLWQLKDPALYRVTARLATEGGAFVDETSVRCGFRDFRFADGYFRLNGKRVFLKSAHFGGDSPLTGIVPFDPNLVRQDFLQLKAMGFNMARCIAGLGRRTVMDLADEIGLMVYDESYASWCMQPSAHLPERWNESVGGMIRRDRNHPSVVIWGLLNETSDGPVFRHAVSALPFVKSLDDTRVVMLNSGRFDNGLPDKPGEPGKALLPEAWAPVPHLSVPFVACNRTGAQVTHDGTVFPTDLVALHVGAAGEPAALRFTAAADGPYKVTARIRGIAGPPAPGPIATSAVWLFAAGKQLFADTINCGGKGNETAWSGSVELKKGQTLDLLCGSGNETFNSDTTGVEITVTGPDGKAHDAAAEWSTQSNPNGVWTYGYLPSADPSPTGFVKAVGASNGVPVSIGSLSNPGAADWQDLLGDKHPYQSCPHTASVIHTLRTIDGGGERPLFISEYGFGSANNLLHLMGHYNQVDVGYAFDRAALERLFNEQFTPDWERWGLAGLFGNMENYFRQCVAMEAQGRLLGTSAVRSNPRVVAHSLTACHDTVVAAEGLITSFREPKPGVHDAMSDAWSPLRFSVFSEPLQAVSGGTVRIEATLVNEDALKPGKYPVRIQILGPGGAMPLDKVVEIEIPDPATGPEPPFATPIFGEDVKVDGPGGRYRVFALFQGGAAAEGGEAEFWLHDPAQMPAVGAEVVLWGDDPELAAFLRDRGVRVRAFDAAQASGVVLVGRGAGDWDALNRQIAAGATALFLCPSVFAREGNATALLPLAHKGSLLTVNDWLYQNNDWAMGHPAFAGLPTGLLDYQYYREILGNQFYSGLDKPDIVISGMINTSFGYASGLTLAAYRVGQGRIVLNSLLLRENLSPAHPVAERLLRNLLNWAAEPTRPDGR